MALDYNNDDEDLSFLDDLYDVDKPEPHLFPSIVGYEIHWPLYPWSTIDEGEKFAFRVLDVMRKIQIHERAPLLRAIQRSQFASGVFSGAVSGYLGVIADHIDVE